MNTVNLNLTLIHNLMPGSKMYLFTWYLNHTELQDNMYMMLFTLFCAIVDEKFLNCNGNLLGLFIRLLGYTKYEIILLYYTFHFNASRLYTRHAVIQMLYDT